MRGAPGPLGCPRPLLARVAGLARRPRLIGSVQPYNFPRVGALGTPVWAGGGSARLGLGPDPRLLLLQGKPLPASQALLFHCLPGDPQPQPRLAVHYLIATPSPEALRLLPYLGTPAPCLLAKGAGSTIITPPRSLFPTWH